MQYGKLGHGNERGESSPKRVEALANIPVAHIACGSLYVEDNFSIRLFENAAKPPSRLFFF